MEIPLNEGKFKTKFLAARQFFQSVSALIVHRKRRASGQAKILGPLNETNRMHRKNSGGTNVRLIA